MADKASPQHLFAECSRACTRFAGRCDRGRMARGHRPVARRGRAAARSDPWRYGDQCRDGARQGSEGQAARPRRTDRGAAAQRGSDRVGRCCRPRLHQSHLEAVGLDGRAAVRAARGRCLWAKRDRGGREGQCRICLGQSDRADACRPLPRRGVRRCAGKPAGLRGLSMLHANITSTMPAPRSMCSRARLSCATARRSARTSARSRKGFIPAII